ncbi:unnamed protein product, partial [Ectocarpus sp. 12 AP-2014]
PQASSVLLLLLLLLLCSCCRCCSRWKEIHNQSISSFCTAGHPLSREGEITSSMSSTATEKSPGWEERWSTEESQAILQKFAAEETKMHDDVKKKPFSWLPCLGAKDSVDDESEVDVDSNLQEVKAGKVDKDGNFNNWASTAPSKPGKVFAPESVSEVQD